MDIEKIFADVDIKAVSSITSSTPKLSASRQLLESKTKQKHVEERLVQISSMYRFICPIICLMVIFFCKVIFH